MPLQSPSGSYYVAFESTVANSVHTNNSAATTNATSVKTSAGKVYSVVLSNQNAAIRYFKFYNKASAPVVGTDTPVIIIPVAASSTLVFDHGPFGSAFSTGIAYAVTGAITDADTTAITAGDFKVSINYA